MLRVSLFAVSQLHTLRSSEFTRVPEISDNVFIGIEDICIISKELEIEFVRRVLYVVCV